MWYCNKRFLIISVIVVVIVIVCFLIKKFHLISLVVVVVDDVVIVCLAIKCFHLIKVVAIVVIVCCYNKRFSFVFSTASRRRPMRRRRRKMRTKRDSDHLRKKAKKIQSHVRNKFFFNLLTFLKFIKIFLKFINFFRNLTFNILIVEGIFFNNF